MKIKRFVVFSGRGYSEGGWSDFQSSHATLETAKLRAKQILDKGDHIWVHIIDLATGKPVESLPR